MTPSRSNLLRAVLLAFVVLAASGLAVAFRPSAAGPLAGLLLLAVGVLAIDAVRPEGPRPLRAPSAVAWVLSLAVLLAGGLVAAGKPDQLAAFLPVLGACVVVPVVIPERRRCAARSRG